VTNKGVGGLLKKWGEGASLIRKEWKGREENEKKEDMDMKKGRDHRMAVDEEDDDDDDDDDDEEDEEEEEEPDDLEATPRMMPRRTIGVHSPPSSRADTHVANNNLNTDGSTTNNTDLTNLTESLNSLSLVPNSIRFGRGGKGGGFLPRGQGRTRDGGSRGGKHGRSDRDVMEVDVVSEQVLRGRGRGRGARRRRGRGVAQVST